jgi:DNA-binding NtrC family response regulator
MFGDLPIISNLALMPSRMTSPEIHVLVVGDEPDLCSLTKDFLDLQGEIVVDTAFSAQGARNILAYKRYDAILPITKCQKRTASNFSPR